MSSLLAEIAARLLRHPAAPYHESAVAAEVESICAEHRLDCSRDKFGNLLVKLQTAPALRPFVLAAHMDHPGFEIVEPLPRDRFVANFLGGVGDGYFRPGIPLRLMPGAIPAKLGKRIGREMQFEIRAQRPCQIPPRFAVWELEDFAVRKGLIHARACDDLIGVAAILATLIELKRTRARVHVIGVISRAEEVGFHGALTVAASKILPTNSLVVSLETSRELPPVKIGQGVIIRVGDRASVFDSTATRFLSEVAAEIQKAATPSPPSGERGGVRGQAKPFHCQRALMSGGTCEATAYQEFGYQTAAVCVALGNYHNCAPQNKIAAEYVSLADAESMVALLTAAARQMPRFKHLTSKLPARLHSLLKDARKKLR
jgi:putative aminopeptidase FrvX